MERKIININIYKEYIIVNYNDKSYLKLDLDSDSKENLFNLILDIYIKNKNHNSDKELLDL